MKLINKSLGIQFRGEFLQASIYAVAQNQIDAHFFFGGMEFVNLQEFVGKFTLTPEEVSHLQKLMVETANRK